VGKKKTSHANVDTEYAKAKAKGMYPFLFKEGDKVTVTLREDKSFGWYERVGMVLEAGDHPAVIVRGPGEIWAGGYFFYCVKIPVAGLVFVVVDVAVEDIRKRGSSLPAKG
jgi:hypothetical protein